MEQLGLLFVVLFAAVLAEPLSRRIGLSSAVLMTVFGLVLAVLPFVPDISLEPHLILPLVLPPLLYAAARRTSWRQFVVNWAAITLRAVGLVLVTAAAVAAAFSLVHPAVPFAAAVALGAVVAPPDPIAATAMASKLGLPRRLTSVLEGEGLFNDVTAIVVYSVAIEAVVSGHFSAWDAAWRFVVSAVVAVLVGGVFGWASSRLVDRLDEAAWKVALTLLVPFAAYAVTEWLDASAVLAVLVCALYLTDAATRTDDSGYRLVGDVFWEIIELLVGGFAFGLIGLELSTVLREAGASWPRMLGGAVVVIVVVVALRLVWLLATLRIFRTAHRDHLMDEPYTWKETVVTWWAGMRGVATVALALALPLTVADGRPFPFRAEILFTAFAVVLFTLLVQGPTLPLVVRWTGVHADTAAERRMELDLWNRVLRAELAELKRVSAAGDLPDDVYERLRTGLLQRLTHADPQAADADETESARRAWQRAGRFREIQRDVQAAGRREALDARREPGVPPDVVDRVMRRLDFRAGP
ncbi:Na+/H+ antiporter [Actinomadura flavalba]|uniref:Na+/H+ antiporter n=1 Tax=Actinomadura flavalba TaxID=1120938 RepID=UPI00037FF33E|nr:Na+/H+ antiporter [Actinomadura flavalba]